MVETAPLTKECFPELHKLVLRTEPFAAQILPTLSHFKAAMVNVEGFLLLDQGKLIGAVTFNGFVPMIDIVLNVAVDEAYRGKWTTPKILRKIGRFVFGELGLPRMSSFGIKDLTPAAEMALLKGGFRLEGVKERAVLFPDGYHDLVLYGVLRERWRWL